ncbi:HAD family hydrolase [bacterium]|nr:HAD family hydrolase [bacterium]
MTILSQHSPQTLIDFHPSKPFFIGIDSDGCVFDSMELKQKECFTHNTVRFFTLQPVYPDARATSEFVNLYSKWRGANRFPSLIRVMDFLAARPEIKKLGFEVPRLESLRKWMASETKLGNPALKAHVEKTGDPELKRVLEWSLEINRDIEKIAVGVGPFAPVMDFLKTAGKSADLIVVSQTPAEALEREWRDNGMDGYVRIIAGQEYGTKTEQLNFAAGGKYDDNHMLMIGDALGDLKAAREAGTLFFPINPGAEEESWENLLDEGLGRFLAGTFAGDYETALIKKFESLLPEKPSW